jgi:predicted molibdopterin-dependent oxidoreductase YjgC
MFVTSRGVTNEVYYVAQKVMRFLGSNQIDNSARLCHSPSTSGLKTTVGVAATTCSYKDWYDADLIVFLGSNPANDQPVTTKYLYEARRRGARVLSVNAFREPGLDRYWIPSNVDSALFGTELCDRTFLVRVGGDAAFLAAVQKVLIGRGAVASEFIASATSGYENFAQALASQPMDEPIGCRNMYHRPCCAAVITPRSIEFASIIEGKTDSPSANS